MSTDRDVTRVVRSWLEDGATSLPERVLDDVLDQLPTTPQRRALRPAWRFHPMSSPFKIILAAAAIGALALVSIEVLPRSPDIVGAPAPSASPSPSPALLEGYGPSLAAGTYRQPLGTGTWTVAVPEGWEDFYSILWKDVDGVSTPPTAGGPGEVAFGWWQVANVFADPCHWQDSLADPPVGPTVDDLVTAFLGQVGVDGSATDVVFAGYPAKRIELSVPADLDVATCDAGIYRPFIQVGETLTVPDDFVFPGGGTPAVHYILEIDGQRFMMRSWQRPDASAQDVAEMEAMLTSSVIDPPAATHLPDGPLAAGTYVATPFAAPGSDACFTPPQSSCIDATDDDAIEVTFTVPEGWEGENPVGVTWPSDTERAALIFVRGASLAADPCHNDGTGDVPVGPSVSNFVWALDGHPLLSVTDPIDVTLGGHPGTYMELQVPDNPTIQGSSQPASQEGCPVYRPWEPWYLAQGPGELWHLWIVDVDGVRVVVQAIDHADTSADVKAQLQAIVDSVRIERSVVPTASASPVSMAWSPASLEQDWPAPVRAEPVGEPVVVRYDGGSAPDAADNEAPAYHDPVGDMGSSAAHWVDIEAVRPASRSITYVDLATPIPSPVSVPTEAWIAYGLVVDNDRDGIADMRLGIDNLPGGNHRAWRTDLYTGQTQSAVGPPYGYVGDVSFDTFYPGGTQGPATARFSGGGGLARFYAWASVIEDGRIVATDYAPDAGWLDMDA